MQGFIIMNRDLSTLEMVKHPKAFALLALIALRARWSCAENCIHPLEPGEALIGDCRACGLTQGEYRSAKKLLTKFGQVAFRATSRGTVAKLMNKEVFDVFGNDRNKPRCSETTIKRQTNDKPATTNEDGIKNRKSKPKDARDRGMNIPQIEIRDRGDILGNKHLPVQMALAVIEEPEGSEMDAFLFNAWHLIGDDPFRRCVEKIWAEMRVDNVAKPGALLRNSLKEAMKVKRDEKLSAI